MNNDIVEPGAAVTLRAGDAEAALYPAAGGRLGQIVANGRELLRGPEHAASGWAMWGAYALVPWSNRIPGGTFSFAGETITVPVNFDDGSAIHGLAAQAAWTVVEATASTAELEIELECDRYLVTGTQRFALTADGLDHTVGVSNRAPWSVPVGLGIHPWFVLGPVRVPADETWRGEGPMPDGPPYPVPPELDLRTKRTPPLMDRCYCALTDTVAEIGDLTLSWDGPVTDVVVYTGTPGWVCVEPVTMATDAFRLAESGFDGTPMAGTGIVALDEGDTLSVTYRYAWA